MARIGIVPLSTIMKDPNKYLHPDNYLGNPKKAEKDLENALSRQRAANTQVENAKAKLEEERYKAEALGIKIIKE